MPFKAFNQNNDILTAFELNERPEGEFRCTACEQKLITVWDSPFVVNHFRHKVTCPYQFEPESKEHMNAKYFLYKKFNEHKFYDVKIEEKVENRIADLILYSKTTGNKAVFEIQCSAISAKEFEERRLDWEKNKYYLAWIFGSKNYADTKRKVVKWNWKKFNRRTYYIDDEGIFVKGYKPKYKATNIRELKKQLLTACYNPNEYISRNTKKYIESYVPIWGNELNKYAISFKVAL